MFLKLTNYFNSLTQQITRLQSKQVNFASSLVIVVIHFVGLVPSPSTANFLHFTGCCLACCHFEFEFNIAFRLQLPFPYLSAECNELEIASLVIGSSETDQVQIQYFYAPNTNHMHDLFPYQQKQLTQAHLSLMSFFDWFFCILWFFIRNKS